MRRLGLIAGFLVACGDLPAAATRDAGPDAPLADAGGPDAIQGGRVTIDIAPAPTFDDVRDYQLVITRADGALVQETMLTSGDTLAVAIDGGEVLHAYSQYFLSERPSLVTIVDLQPGDHIPLGAPKPATPSDSDQGYQLSVAFTPIADVDQVGVFLSCAEEWTTLDVPAEPWFGPRCLQDGHVYGLVLAFGGGLLRAAAPIDVVIDQPTGFFEHVVTFWWPLEIGTVRLDLPVLPDERPLYASLRRKGRDLVHLAVEGVRAGEVVSYQLPLLEGAIEEVIVSAWRPSLVEGLEVSVTEQSWRLVPGQLAGPGVALVADDFGGQPAGSFWTGFGSEPRARFEWEELGGEPGIDPRVLTAIRFGGWLVLAPADQPSPVDLYLHGLQIQSNETIDPFEAVPTVQRISVDDDTSYHTLLTQHGELAEDALRSGAGEWKEMIVRRSRRRQEPGPAGLLQISPGTIFQRTLAR